MKNLSRILLLALYCSLILAAFPVQISAAQSVDVSKIRDIYMPETQIVNPPAVVQNVDTAAKLGKLKGEIRPQGAWLTLNSEGRVVLDDTTMELAEALDKMPNVIPFLQIPDMACADIVSAAVKDQYYDLMLASQDPAVLKKLYEDKIGYTRLILISDQQDPQKLVETALTNGAMIVAMKNPSREPCEYLQQRFLSVLVNPGLDNDEKAVRACVDCGGDFVVLDGYQTAYDMYASVKTQSYVRRAYVVGHRGMVTYAPDNTAEGVQDAFENGADAAEIDIRYTADKQIVCFHNNDLNSATLQPVEDPSKRIEEYTLEQLKQFTLRYNTGHIYKTAKIPTLEEILTVLQQYPDKILVIEFKDFLVDPAHLAEVLAQYDVMDQCVFIGFGQGVLDRHYPDIPSIGASLLDGGYPVDDAMGCVDRYYSVSVGSVASYSPSYAISEEAIAMLHCRGLNLNLWTAGSFTVMEDMAQHGAMFITTDRVEDHDYVHNLYLNMGSDQLFAGYKQNTEDKPAASTKPTKPTVPATTAPADQSANDGGFNPGSILPWFFLPTALVFVIAIFIKIYNVRKK